MGNGDEVYKTEEKDGKTVVRKEQTLFTMENIETKLPGKDGTEITYNVPIYELPLSAGVELGFLVPAGGKPDPNDQLGIEPHEMIILDHKTGKIIHVDPIRKSE